MSHLPRPLTIPHRLLDHLAEALSYILHPAVLMTLAVLLASFLTRGSFGRAVLDVVILVIGLLPGLIYIYVNVRRGRFSHYHLLLKEERRRVLPLLFVGMLGSFALYVLTGAPVLMMQAMVIGLSGGAGAILISRFWKISLHAAVAMGCAGLFLALSWPATGLFAALGLLAGVARVWARQHTAAQVIVGWIYGFSVGSLLDVWLRL